MRWVMIVIGAVAALVLLVLVVGLARPREHVATITTRLEHPAAAVWAQISDIARSSEWVPEVSKVERLADVDGRPSWRETFGGFEATTVIREAEPGRRMVKEILPTGPFHGSWTWELAADGDGTRLTITERGTVDNALLRGLMVFHDNEKSMRDYVAALERRLATSR